MQIKTLGFPANSDGEVILSALSDLSRDLGSCSFAAIHHRVGSVDTSTLAQVAGAVHCASSCNGIMFDGGLAEIGVFAVFDVDGDYGTACAEIADDTFQAARVATRSAVARAGRDGEAPDLVWISITPGAEEEAILGIENIVGRDVPIIGGSAADDTVAGEWLVGDGSVQLSSGLVVSVFFCSTPLQFAYQNGYEPTASFGVVTKAEGRRITEIDGRSAATVYQEWNNGDVPVASGEAPVNILAEATFWPLGRKVSQLGAVPYYLLAHPCGSNPDGSIDLFAEVAEGETLTQMTGDKAALAARAGRVADFALKAGDMASDRVAGALMVYCGGCMLAVQDRLDQVYSGVNQALGSAPFLGVFTFGEQGNIHGVGNRHGNLMISCITFARGD